jgi:hypothetical protein
MEVIQVIEPSTRTGVEAGLLNGLKYLIKPLVASGIVDHPASDLNPGMTAEGSRAVSDDETCVGATAPQKACRNHGTL